MTMIPKPRNSLPAPVIAAAVQGDPMAIQTVLRHYRGYIEKLSSCVLYDACGNVFVSINPDVKEQLENALITGILQFKPAA